jgi:hypothetical protein
MMREITDEELEKATVAELEELEFRVYAELQNRHDEAFTTLLGEAPDEDDDFDDDRPY